MVVSLRKLSIKSKAALVTTVGVLLLFAAFAMLEIHRVRAEMRALLGAQQLSLVARVADELDDKIRSTHGALIVTAQATPPAMAADLAAMERSLRDQPGFRSLFDDVYLIGRDGRVLIDLPALERRGIDVRDREYFRRTMETRKPVISEPYMGRGRKEPTVMMTAPILDADGRVVGILAGAIHPLRPNFLGKLREARAGTTGRFALFGMDRTIIVSQYAERIMSKGPAPGVSQYFDNAMAGREGWEEAENTRGLRALYSYKPLASVPWVLAAALPVEEAYAPIAAAQTQAIGLAALLALLLAPLIWFGMQYVLSPVAILRDAIRKIRGNPDSDALVRMPRQDELGDLAVDFNAMTTERRDAILALRSSEERYRSLTQLSSDWYWEQDEHFRLVSFDGNRQDTGVSPRSPEAFGKAPWEFPSLGMTEAQWAAHRAQLEAHQPFRDFEVCRPGAQGQPTYALVSGEPMFANDGRFRGYRGVARDVTAVKAAQNEARFRQNLESLMLLMSSRFLNAREDEVDAIILDTLREIGTFAGADRCFVNLLDEKAQRYSVSHEWCAEGIESKYAARQDMPVTMTGELWERLARNEVTFIVTGELPAGSAMKAMLASVGVKSSFGVPVASGGRLMGCLAFDAVREERRWSDDLTLLLRIGADILGGVISQRRAAAALRASEEKFAKAFRASPVFISIATVDEGRYVEINDAFERATGHARSEIIGRTGLEIGIWKHPADRERAVALLRDNGRIDRLETELCKKSGETMLCELWGERMEIEGRQCVIWITSDVTARKKTEAQILQLNESLERRVRERTTELEAVVQELAAFSYTISHDLRAPLRAITGFSERLANNTRGKLEGENRHYLERIVSNSRRMGRLIDEVLEYSRLGRSVVARQTVDLDALVSDIAGELRERYPCAAVVVHPLGRANADPTMIRQIFQNLIGNALKYSSKREHPRVEIGALHSAGGVEYFVRDDGVGFDMMHASHLFELFSRLHSDRDFEGTGAGLAIVKRLVERHNGRIRAEAEPDKGATFLFTI